MSRGRGRGMSRGRGRGTSSGRGRTTCRGRGHGGGRSGRGFVPSTLPWKEIDIPTDQSPTPLPFSSPTGPNVPLTGSSSMVDFFDHFFDQDFLGLIMEETNR